MMRCIQLAKNGLGTTYPNPLVGSVIVHNNRIIGEGWHHRSGTPHAEVNAIQNVENKELLSESTIYVSLEPCGHFGKTPPCADLITSYGIKKVVIGISDPNPKVNGKGIQKLLNAGCDVVIGVLEEECNNLNKRFFTFHQKKRPYILLKWAETKDGFIAPNNSQRSSDKKPVWITNDYSRQYAHKLRTEEQSILVGTNTVLYDNPSLDSREWHGINPVRIVIDRNLNIPKNATVFNDVAKTIFITNKKASNIGSNIYETVNFSEDLTRQICDIVYRHGLQSLLIEGGTRTIQSFIDANLWDEAAIFVGNKNFGEGITSPKLSGKIISEEKIKDDIVLRFKNISN